MLHGFLQVRTIIFVRISSFQMESIRGMNLIHYEQMDYEQIPVAVPKACHHLLAGE